MVIIGLATVRHSRLSRIRVNLTGPTVGQLNKKRSSTDFNAFSTIICTLPHAIKKLYLIFSVNVSKSPFRLATENLMSQITRQLLYINASMTFYL